MEEINIVLAPCTKCGAPMIVEDAWVEDGTGVIDARCTDAECGEIILIKATVGKNGDNTPVREKTVFPDPWYPPE